MPEMPPIVQFVQSESEPRVLRAMHAHKLQWDVWHLTRGEAFVQLYDHVADDHATVWLTPGDTLYIPPGLSHGFYTPPGCTLMYGLTREHDGTDEYEWNAYDFGGRGPTYGPGRLT
jgi:dTDP-4-dehydrorhamnose 3,5-epimerase-like enzyme